MTPNARELFFQLLQAGLWSRPVDPESCLADKATWTEIIRQAKQQTVTGVLFDGISASACLPPRELKLQLAAEVVGIEQGNRRVNEALAQTARALEAQRLPYMLLKGAAAGAVYPNPGHRTSGDIDLYMAPEDCMKAQQTVFRDTVSLPDKDTRHLHATVNGVLVENHFRLAHNPTALYQKLEAELLCDGIRLPLTHITIDGQRITCPSPTFSVLFMLEHMAFHLISGLGLRQLCDWARYCWYYSDSIDRPAIARIVGQYRLERLANIFSTICVDHLGMPEECLPIPLTRNKRTARDKEYVMKTIMEGGNFGKHFDALHSSRKHVHLPAPIRKAISILVMLRNRRKYNLIAPSLLRNTLLYRLMNQ